MLRYVCDTSVILKWFNQENEAHVAQAEALFNDWRRGRVYLASCDLAVYELANALHKGKGLSAGEVKEALGTLFGLPLDLQPPDRGLAEKTAELAEEYDLTSYDACFLALAKIEGCQLITDNPRHQGRAKDGSILKLEDYPPPRIPGGVEA